MRLVYVFSNKYRIKKGVSQGRILSPILFNICSEYVKKGYRQRPRVVACRVVPENVDKMPSRRTESLCMRPRLLQDHSATETGNGICDADCSRWIARKNIYRRQNFSNLRDANNIKHSSNWRQTEETTGHESRIRT